MQAESSNSTMAQTHEIRRVGDADGVGAIVFDPSRLPQAGPDLFSVQAWGARARPVTEGGRGQAWFVDAGGGGAVLRHYRRGGMVARLAGDRYLWTGQDRTRSFLEFRLLAWLHARGLRVPAPLAAHYRRRGLVYRADILVERIPAARSLAQRLAEGEVPPPWSRIGREIASMHRLGVDHADLNAHNVLLDAREQVWLIDFDRGARRPPGGWQAANLERLRRSLRKVAASSPGVEVGYASLREGYLHAMREQER
jgi:3-deoxy-D-manno-octulosonic acid kinase